MSEHQIKEVKKMCKAFCISTNIKWTRKFERMYVKEFFKARRMDIMSIARRRALGIHPERRKTTRHIEMLNTTASQAATEGETD